jgi:hypothetical protein
MRKLTLVLDDIRVESYAIDPGADFEGTIAAFETQPNSDFNPCTGASCTYPVQLCRTCHCAADEPQPAGRKQKK